MAVRVDRILSVQARPVPSPFSKSGYSKTPLPQGTSSTMTSSTHLRWIFVFWLLACGLPPSPCPGQTPKPEAARPIPIQGNQTAPEFRDIESWINSPPLSMKSLRGKVVVIHFLAYG